MRHHTDCSLAAFWPDYVRAHRQPATRWLHFVGNTNLFVWLVVALIRRDLRLVGVGVLSSYALAWVGHFGVEGNVPITFRAPVKAALCDLWMYVKMWRGTMDAEVARYTKE